MERRHPRDQFAGAITFGAFLILLAITYLRNPNIIAETEEFIRDFKPVQITQSFWWLAPSSNHPELYTSVSQFCYIFGVVQVIVLGLLLARASSNRERTRRVSDVIFWLGAGYLFGVLSNGALSWISFVGVLIILVGVCIVVRSVILLVVSRRYE